MDDLTRLLTQADAAARAGQWASVRSTCAQVLAASPGHPAARFLLAQAALAQGDLHAAAEALTAVAAVPDATLRAPLARAFDALARALRARGAHDAAAMAFEQATRQTPDDAQAWHALGSACMEAAQEHLNRAHAGKDRAAGYDPLAAAQVAFARAAALAPQSAAIAASRAMAARHVCAFDDARAATSALTAMAPSADFACEPMSAVTLLDDPRVQRRAIEGWVAVSLPAPISAPAVMAARGTRLRVGYLSSDLHDHATAHLTAGMFELHDRARLETFAYATDRDDGSPMRARLRAAFTYWRDLRAIDDAAAAAAIARDGLDVLVDLKGHTHGARLAILARRPARRQIHYLGFPGTLGYPGAIDALVADHVVAPPGSNDEFGEPLLRLPVCYQVNDRRRVLPPRAARASAGLPDGAVVLACFNQPWKLDATFVNAWLAVLREIPQAVLWLLAPHALTQRNLQALAVRAGVAPERLIFAPLVDQATHLSRLQCADLALDVLPYGSHTTGSDALFCGVPLLALRGTTFAGRVGASLLRAVELPELVSDSFVTYTAMLANLAGDRARLAHYRAHLDAGRERLPLFDTAGFTRVFEALLEDVAR